jgi:hypothetical protein
MKAYFHSENDPRDRFEHEHAFHRLLQHRGITQTPRALAWDAGERLGLFEFVPDPKLEPAQVTAAHVSACALFFKHVNTPRSADLNPPLPDASEACFSIADHARLIDQRVQRLASLAGDAEVPSETIDLISRRLRPAWTHLSAQLASLPEADIPLKPDLRCLSPSDFGFHNALASPRGLLFFDFEYAGWDDPAKMACDFFCQPEIPAPAETLPLFVEQTCLAPWSLSRYAERVNVLLPAYHIKWACIILNVFLKDASRRRAFADTGLLTDEARRLQMAKAHAQLDAVGQEPPWV